MKHTRASSLALSLVVLAGLILATSVAAHPIVVDGAITDWFATTPITSPGAHPNSNTAQVARNAAQQGEFNWRDAILDQRIITATGTLTREVDLRNFRVTADATNLYLFLNVEAVTALNGGSAVEFQVGIDDGTGSHTALVDGGATTPISTTAAAPWRYLVQTRFQSGTLGSNNTISTAAPRVYSAPETFSTTGTGGVLKKIGIDTAELRIPWNLVGGAPGANGKRLRFSVATLYSDRAAPLPSDGVPSSRVMDTMSATQSAAADLADDQLGYAVDVFFDGQGEVFSPLLITEFQANAVGPDNTSAQDTEWIEIYNAGAQAIDLSGYKVGAAAKRLPAGVGGMFKFPAGATLAPGAIAIAANHRDRFNTVYPGIAGLPNVDVYGVASTNATFRMTQYAAWSGGPVIAMLDGPTAAAVSFEEQVVLLDGSDTLADIVTYKSAALPNTGAHPGVVPLVFTGSLIPESRSYERCPAGRDTNDAAFDFIAHEGRAAQTPGAICGGTALALTKTAPATTVVGGQIDYTLTYANSGANDTNIYITDTLPLNVSYIAGSQSAPTVFGSAPIEFTDLGGGVLQWKLPLIGTGTGTISFAVQLDNTPALIGQSRTNSAVIAGRLPDSDTSDNSASATTQITAIPQADVGIAKALASPPAELYTGRPAVYTISYSNTGDLPAASTLITDSIPAGLSFVAASHTPILADSNKVVFDVGTVASAVDATIVLTFTVTAVPAGGTPIINTATIGTSMTPELIMANNSASATSTTAAAPPADLALAKAADVTEIELGEAITYSFTISNLGGQAATSIQVVDSLPAGLTYQPGSSGAAGDPAISGDGRTLTWSLPASFDLPTGATRSFQFKAVASTVPPNTAVVNNAVVSAAGDTQTQNNSASSEATTVTEPSTAPGTQVYVPIVMR